MALSRRSVLLVLCLSSICVTWVKAGVFSTKDISRPFGSLENKIDDLKPLPGLNSREDEDEEEFTTVKGPGHEGILKGLSGIFAGVVNGNLNGVVQSSFEFVPKAHHPNVNKVYSSLLGKTDPPPTTAKPTLRSVVAQNNGNEEAAAGGAEAEEEEEAGSAVAGVTSAPIRRRPIPVRRPIRPVNPDDEEEEADFLERRTSRPRPNNQYRPRPVAEDSRPKATTEEAPSEDYSV